MATLRDLRYAARVLRNNSGFTIIAVLALALGIGANTAIFTVVNAVLLRPLPYPHSDRILQVVRAYPNGRSDTVSLPKYYTWKATNRTLADLSLFDLFGPGMNLSGGGEPEQVRGVHVSLDYFRLFGAAPVLGRTFTADEDQPHGPRVAVLAHGLWQRRFGASRDLVWRAITLNGEPFMVIGIMPREFESYPPADVWIPLQADPNSGNQGHYLLAAGRLKPGLTRAAAEAELRVAAEQFRRRYPNFIEPRESAGAIPLQESIVGDVRRPLMILAGAVGFVLLIACANVANLLLARAAGRSKEIAIRTAIGAGRWHLVRQLLSESLLLALLGGVLGLLLGSWGLRGLLALTPTDIPRIDQLGALPDVRVLGFTLLVSLLTGALFGLAPALQISRPDLSVSLKEGGARSTSGLRRNRARALLVVSEIALSLVLLIGAALLIRTFVSLRGVRPGFDSRHVLTLKMSLAGSKYAVAAPVANFDTQVLVRIAALPAVQYAASVTSLPLELGPDLPFTVEGRDPAAPNGRGDSQWRAISPDFFRVMAIPLLRGRYFTQTDSGNTSGVVIVNETMARQFWKDQDPIGQRITIGKGFPTLEEAAPRQVVGVVGDIREYSLSRNPPATMYVPYGQVSDALTALVNQVLPTNWVVRTALDPLSLAAAVKREVQSVDRQLPISQIRSMDQVIAASTARESFNMLLLAIFAGVALLLAAIGIYGVMSYAVEQRTHEIGIRMALGAGGSDMVRMVVGQGMRLALVGVAAGLAAAYGLTRVLASLLFGVRPADPASFAGVAGLLAAVALLASYMPARRATKVDPIIALRYE